jgi:hypothetical protein
MELNIQIHAPSTLSIYKIGARTYLKGAKKGNFLPPTHRENGTYTMFQKRRALLLKVYFRKFFMQKFF